MRSLFLYCKAQSSALKSLSGLPFSGAVQDKQGTQGNMCFKSFKLYKPEWRGFELTKVGSEFLKRLQSVTRSVQE